VLRVNLRVSTIERLLYVRADVAGRVGLSIVSDFFLAAVPDRLILDVAVAGSSFAVISTFA
jgi:hypothetical protein